MQAHRLRAADAPHHAHVVKALVDHAAEAAAFLLADSSCLVFSLASSSSSTPCTQHIPAPCTDACFLRLQARLPAGASSPLPSPPLHLVASRGSAMGFAGSAGEPAALRARSLGVSAPEARLGLQGLPSDGDSGVTVAGRPRLGSARVVDAAEMSRGSSAGCKAHVFLLAARPGRGGSCTDLMAWHCQPDEFSRVATEMACGKPSNNGVGKSDRPVPSLSRKVARLDAPHGIAVKLAATVNVVALYSVAAGKVWIMGVKALEGDPSCSSRSVKDVFPENSVGHSMTRKTLVEKANGKGALQVSDPLQKQGKHQGLHLIKCAVVDCNTPVYSLHLSLQHLFLGEAGGIRVFQLRPLVKPGKKGGFKERGHVKEKSYLSDRCKPRVAEGITIDNFNIDSNVSGHQEMEQLSERDKDKRETGWSPAECFNSEEIPRDLHKGNQDGRMGKIHGESQSVIRAGPRNGMHQNMAIFEVPEVVMGGLGYVDKHEETNTQAANGFRLDGFLFGEKHPVGHWEEGGDSESNGRIIASSKLGKAKAESGPRNGSDSLSDILSVPASRCTGVNPLPLSSPPKVNGDGRNGLICQTAQGITSSLSPASAISEVTPRRLSPADMHTLNECNPAPLQSSKQGASLFVALVGHNGVSCANGLSRSQVVDIQALGARNFIVLDSSGKLHLMTLQNSWFTNDKLDIGQLRARPLKSSHKVESLAVLPLQKGAASSARKLWLADGGYSVHMASLLMGSNSTDDVGKSGVWDSQPELSVVRAIFTSDPVSALIATSSNSVMVLSPGKIVTYVMTGA